LDGNEQEIWYEVDEAYAEYLCYERADAFLLGCLPYAMAFNHNITVDGDISEKLYYQLTTFFIPAMSKYTNYYKNISITCRLNHDVYNTGIGVGTGFSGGVDSFYTILSNLHNTTLDFNVTHLTFFKVGATGSYGGEEATKRFRKRINVLKSFVEENNLEFVIVDSNISDYMKMSYNFVHTYRSLSAVLALQKLFKIYYYASGLSLKEFSFNEYDSAFYDLLNVYSFSTENVIFYSSGATESRIEKTEFISTYESTYNYLNVCNDHDENCRNCSKCIRTMGGLYALGKLDLYKNVFDIEDFYKNINKRLGFILAATTDKTAESYLCLEIVKVLKQRKVGIPILAYFYAIPLTIKFNIIALARKNSFLKKWWHKRMHRKLGVNFPDIDS
jgi:hypothetical protein